ncbi:uncharacterized protein [Onthophagus taurus]|uniref:uncharacterized protein n=1 Tax=Onthophagus taurus TaxID=166361 RepID=UPI000C1FEBA1|nr:uncharacterized protein LOC111416620 [Onthophagus taurus]XP_022904449.1 uncharacterized protein LOC111416620 [Onthophagus taurus]
MDESKKDIKDIISTLTHPVSITDGNRKMSMTSNKKESKNEKKSTFFTIFNRSDKNDMLYKNFKLEEIRDSSTQTSKTIIELARFETKNISPDSLSSQTYQDDDDDDDNDLDDETYETEYTNDEFKKFNAINYRVEPLELNLTETETSKNPSLIETFLRKPKNNSKYTPKQFIKSHSFVENSKFMIKNSERSTTINSDGDKSFMMPTLSSQNKNLLPEVKKTSNLLSPIRRGRSSSPIKPKGKIKIPYIDQSESDISCRNERNNLNARVPLIKRQNNNKTIDTPNPPKTFSKDMLRIDEMSLILVPTENNSMICFDDTNTSFETTINTSITKLQDTEWNIALRGLAEITELCKATDSSTMMQYMTSINQRLLQLLKNPRSHVCRTACQAAGHLFESMKDTRGPEFNDIVDLLLSKTADANKFIRKDANLALDCMVTHISTCQAIKALLLKGPTHKNNLVRSATVRLLICAIVIAGPGVILNPSGNEATRKRIFSNLVKFLEDKNPDTRKYGERLYKVLSKEKYFDMYLKKYIERDDLSKMKKILKAISKSH